VNRIEVAYVLVKSKMDVMSELLKIDYIKEANGFLVCMIFL